MKTIVKNSVYCGMMFLLSFNLHALETSQEIEIVVPEDIMQQVNDTENQIDDQQVLTPSPTTQAEEVIQQQEIIEELNQNPDYEDDLASLNQDEKAAEQTLASADASAPLQQDLEKTQDQEVKQINNDLELTQLELTPEIQNLEQIDVLEQEILEQPALEDNIQEIVEKIEDIELK